MEEGETTGDEVFDMWLILISWQEFFGADILYCKGLCGVDPRLSIMPFASFVFWHHLLETVKIGTFFNVLWTGGPTYLI